MPAAAVIPALIAYIKVVAVKKLVVELRREVAGPPQGVYWIASLFPCVPCMALTGRVVLTHLLL